MALESRGPNNPIGMAMVVFGVLIVAALIAIVISSGLQALQSHVDRSVAAVDQGGSTQLEAKAVESDIRPDNAAGR